VERSPRPTGRRANRRRGQALVEFALVFPIFMLVLSGIMDFGFMLYQRMSVINASREGAHAAIIVSNASTIVLMAQQTANSSATQGGVTPSSVTVQCVSAGGSNLPDCGSAVNGDTVIVTVNYIYHPFFPLLVGTSLNLSSTTQMVLEGLPAT